MLRSDCQASGIIIMVASASERPDSSRNSSTESKLPESEQSESMTGRMSLSLSPNTSVATMPCRATMAFTLPRRVLISPLWLMKRFG